jgi:hypothetical protein
MFGIFSGIRFVSRWIYRSLVIGILLLIILLVAREPFLQSLTEKRIRTTTGLDARMQSMDVALFDQRATLHGLKIYNPAEFGGGVMFDITELHFELDPAALRRGELHFKLLRLDLAELNIVVNERGTNNFQAVRDYRSTRQRKASGPLDDLIDPSLKFTGIDMLNLSITRFTKADLRRSGPPETVPIETRNAVYQRIHSRDDLLRQLTPEIVRDAAGFLHEAWFGTSSN